MASLVPMQCKVSVKLNAGTNDKGGIAFKSLTIGGVNYGAGAAAIAGFVGTIGEFLDHSLALATLMRTDEIEL